MPEVQDILVVFGETYKKRHPISYQQQKVLNALIKCRTATLGAHATVCEDFGICKFPIIHAATKTKYFNHPRC